jgi:lipopolysaccharide export system protein LptC
MLLAFCAALALGSFWALEVMRKSGDEDMPESGRNRPDYFVDQFSYTRMSETGAAQYNISGKKLIHNPADDTNQIALPVVKSLGTDRPPMTMRADRAVVDRNSSKVHLYDNVLLERAATRDSPAFRLMSSYLLILPDDDEMRTDKLVEMTLGKSKLSGTGMVANNATRRFSLASNVHGTYQPPEQAAAVR